MPPDDDQRLIERIRAGRVAAFEELYRRYWTRLYNFCFRYVQSADEAEDVVQDVLGRIWRGRADWRVVGKLDSYLYFAVRNRAFDRLHHEAVVQRWRQRAAADPEISPNTVPPQMEDALQAADIEAAVERALAEMPERRRAVCTLRWTDGLSYVEIAARLGIAEKTVETQIARGLKFLRERVAELRE